MGNNHHATNRVITDAFSTGRDGLSTLNRLSIAASNCLSEREAENKCLHLGLKSGLLLLALTGCAMGPDYQAPEAQAPANWQAVPTAVTVSSEHPALTQWWQSFQDPLLDSLMQKALADNPDLKIAMARIEQARAERKGTRAELFPKVNAVVGAQRNENPFPGFAPGLRFNLFELGFDALWEIDLFGRQQRRFEAASADFEAVGEQYRQLMLSLNAELARNYIDYRRLQHEISITRDNLQTQQHTLELTERLVVEGVASRHDVIRVRAQLETLSSQIPLLEAELSARLRALEVQVGEHPGALQSELSASGALPEAPAEVLLLSPADSLRQRTDLRAADRRLAAATAMQGAAMAELFPKISLSAFFGLRDTDIETLFKSSAFSYGTAANLLQPLLNWGRIQAGIDLAEARQREAYWSYQKVTLDVLKEIESTLIHYLKQEIRRQSLDASVKDLREALRLSRLRYQEGVSSMLDVLEAHRALYVNEVALLNAKASAAIDWIALYKAMGAGLSESEVVR